MKENCRRRKERKRRQAMRWGRGFKTTAEQSALSAFKAKENMS